MEETIVRKIIHELIILVLTNKQTLKIEIRIIWVKDHFQIHFYRDSPDSTVFAPPGNRTIAKTVLIGD